MGHQRPSARAARRRHGRGARRPDHREVSESQWATYVQCSSRFQGRQVTYRGKPPSLESTLRYCRGDVAQDKRFCTGRQQAVLSSGNPYRTCHAALPARGCQRVVPGLSSRPPTLTGMTTTPTHDAVGGVPGGAKRRRPPSLGRDFARLWSAHAASTLGSAVGSGALALVAVLVLHSAAWQVSLLVAMGPSQVRRSACPSDRPSSTATSVR